jgi:C4-dicarboxylate-specific signal transduction histidine kinase
VEVHLEQVLLNLLRNAIEAITEAGMAAARVSIETQRAGDRARVSVRDSGPGVDPAMVERLFDPLQSTKRDGLGVGLRISRSLVEAVGGRLWVEPRQPGGVFHFEVPLAP